jgi:hypothetical protein
MVHDENCLVEKEKCYVTLLQPTILLLVQPFLQPLYCMHNYASYEVD